MKDEKILQDEILSDKDLENVSGGGDRQVYGDSEFLKELGYNIDNGKVSDERIKKQIEKVWGYIGITCKASIGWFYDNKYFLGDKEISRKEAFIHVMRTRGWNETAIKYFEFKDYMGG